MKYIIIVVCVLSFSTGYTEQLFFYTGKDYGSEKQYDPLNLVLNGGFDILQCREGEDRDIFKIPWDTATRNVFFNLADAGKSIRVNGLNDFLSQEVFPLTYSNKARWWPNYQLHLIGGGATYAYLCDYYNYHKVQNAEIYAFFSYYAYHFVNEIVENNYYKGRTVDSIADIYIFDLAGVFLFSSYKVRRFFAKTLNMADWSMQPIFMGPEYHLENTGQYFSIKWKFPFVTNKSWHLFYYWGLNFVAGLSYKFKNGMALSAGAGIRSKKIKVQDKRANQQTMLWVYTGGIFLDKNNSLLASLIINYNYYEAIQLNIYPGIIPDKNFSPGFYLAISQQGRVLYGIIFTYTISPEIYQQKMSYINEGKLVNYQIKNYPDSVL